MKYHPLPLFLLIISLLTQRPKAQTQHRNRYVLIEAEIADDDFALPNGAAAVTVAPVDPDFAGLKVDYANLMGLESDAGRGGMSLPKTKDPTLQAGPKTLDAKNEAPDLTNDLESCIILCRQESPTAEKDLCVDGCVTEYQLKFKARKLEQLEQDEVKGLEMKHGLREKCLVDCHNQYIGLKWTVAQRDDCDFGCDGLIDSKKSPLLLGGKGSGNSNSSSSTAGVASTTSKDGKGGKGPPKGKGRGIKGKAGPTTTTDASSGDKTSPMSGTSVSTPKSPNPKAKGTKGKAKGKNRISVGSDEKQDESESKQDYGDEEGGTTEGGMTDYKAI